MPASKKFVVSVDDSNFQWSKNLKDSIAIVAQEDEDSNAAALPKY